jgi:hypothetical protein
MITTKCLRGVVFSAVAAACSLAVAAGPSQSQVDRAASRGLEWLARHQSRVGHWYAGNDDLPTPMTALAGIALLSEGSTMMEGKYHNNIKKAVDWLTSRSCGSGLIGDPARDARYTYGHGFSMLFLSQVLGEEEDKERREQLIDVLTRAVEFCGRAQTSCGGWGYVSAKDGGDFDEGSTTITQMQGLRGCRNAGIAVPREIIDRGVNYIRKCTGKDGGVRYSFRSGPGGRPPITAAAIACLFNAGDYDSEYVPRILDYCHKNLDNLDSQAFGFWHYTYYYYSQVLYREGGEKWEWFRDKIFRRILSEQGNDGSWGATEGIGPVFITSCCLTILQLPKGALPVYQR